MAQTPKMDTIAVGSPYRQLPDYGQEEPVPQHDSYAQSAPPVPMQNYPIVPVVPVQQPGFYDKPADRRLAPWIKIASILLALYAIACIILTFIEDGRAGTLWALLVTGLLLLPVALLGFRSGMTRNRKHARLFFYAFLAAFIISAILLIVNASRLDVYMDRHCGEDDIDDGFINVNGTLVPFDSDDINDDGFDFGDRNNTNITRDCQDFREYHGVVYAGLGAVFVTWVPSFLLAAYLFWRLCKLYNRENATTTTTVAQPYGSRPMGQPTIYNNQPVYNNH